MEKRTLYGVVMVIAIAAGFLFLRTQPVQASDELLLTGVVKNIDPKTGTVFIDVKSSSCRGMRKFRVSIVDAREMGDFVGRKIDFTIDSSVCDDDEVHTMTLPGENK